MRVRAGIVASVGVAVGLLASPPVDAGEPSRFEITSITVDPPDPVYPTDIAVTVSGTGVCPNSAQLFKVSLGPIIGDGDNPSAGPALVAASIPNDYDGTWSGVLELELADALPGPYWVQAYCFGDEPVQFDAFQVAPPAGFGLSISPGSAAAGVAGSIEAQGAGCVYPLAEVVLVAADQPLAGFPPGVDVAVGEDGSWTATISYDAEAAAGDYTVLGRCGDSTGTGRHVYYDPQDFMLTAAPEVEPPVAPPTDQPPAFTG